MYLVRRVIKVKPGTASKAAAVLARIGKAYEESGQRSPSRVYWSGGTVPGPSNMVYIDWTTDTIDTPSARAYNILAKFLPSSASSRRRVISSFLRCTGLGKTAPRTVQPENTLGK